MNDVKAIMEAAQKFAQKSALAGRVFTPTSPIDEKALFSGRNEQIGSVIDVINQRGQHAVLYGDRGVGKTSLVNVLKEFLGLPRVLAPRVNCDSTDDFASVWKKVFEDVTVTSTRPGIGFSAELQQIASSGVGLLQQPVTPQSVRRGIEALAGVTSIFIIDEFDRLNAETRRAFADLVKLLSDHAVNTTVLLVGVADSVEELILEHQSVERALVQIQVPRMSRDEIIQIVRNGLTRLEMTASDSAVKQISKLAQGLPHYAHLLGLHSVRAALAKSTDEVGVVAVREAIDTSIKNSSMSIRTAYETAIRSARKENLFSDVLLACALAPTSDLGVFAAQDLRDPLKTITKKRYEIPTYAQHLNEFCMPKRGPILQKTGTSRLYRYRFVNPLMQPFVIMKGLQANRIESSILE